MLVPSSFGISFIAMRQRIVATFTLIFLVALAGAQSIRVVTWNLSEYTGGRVSDIQNIVFGSGPAGTMNPDVLAMQEIQSPAAATALLGALNAIQPNQWAVTYGSLTGTSSTSDTAVFYRTAKVTPNQAPFKVAPAGGTSGQPRDTWRFDFRIVGDSADEVLAIYDCHMKAGSTSTDQDRRLIEENRIRTDSNGLPANYLFLICADTNTQSSTQLGYQALVGPGSNLRGQFQDPISRPGNWNLTSSFAFIHTQDPSANGGMNDRHDQVLICNALVDGLGTEYVGKFGQPARLDTWNDPDHSYRAWGNDGTSFNKNLTVTGNAMVGSSIAQSIVTAETTSGGHIPVFLDIKYIQNSTVAGSVALQSYSSVAGTPVTVQIRPVGSVNPVDTQVVMLDALGNFSLVTHVPSGTYDVAVKGSHWLRKKIGNVAISPAGLSGLSFTLVNGDVNGDNAVTLGDFTQLRSAFGSSPGDANWNPNADLNGSGSVSLADFTILRSNFGISGDD